MPRSSYWRWSIRFPGCLLWPAIVVAVLIVYEDLAPNFGRAATAAGKELENAVSVFRQGRLAESEAALAKAIGGIEAFDEDERTFAGKSPSSLAGELRGKYETAVVDDLSAAAWSVAGGDLNLGELDGFIARRADPAVAERWEELRPALANGPTGGYRLVFGEAASVHAEPGLFDLFERLVVAELQLLFPERGLVHGAAAEALVAAAAAGTVTVDGSISLTLYTGGGKAFRQPNALDLTLSVESRGAASRFEGRRRFSATKELDQFAFDPEALGMDEELIVTAGFEALAQEIRGKIRQEAAKE